ncbi:MULTISPECIES: aminoglycoside phosphotransferase family protein [unclassified Nocardia]|uniref:aminoglycoside phosphotransferase family protein n=1 Tax=unclassified Nocardia TaxID=2637762 RepID=UPI00278C06F6|nr:MULTISPECIES: aminoglycoside phosphotransferase family protein [unclassified Nocardia]
MTVPPIPERLERAILFLRGEDDGRVWLDALPSRISDYSRRWALSLDAIADSGAMSCCVYCTTPDGEPAVLKIPVDPESGSTEVQLLRRWSPSGATPRILHHDTDSGVFLMTRILPGTIAWPTDGLADADRFGELLTRLNHPSSPHPPPMKDLADIANMRMDWARDRFADPRYAAEMDDFAAPERLAQAQQVLDILLETTCRHHVLHADLQAKNILEGRDHWHTIDPLGAVGDINAEAALWIAIQDGPASTDERIEQLAEHPLLDPVRLRAWTFVFSIAEYRPYLPASAERMSTFVTTTDLARTISGLQER